MDILAVQYAVVSTCNGDKSVPPHTSPSFVSSNRYTRYAYSSDTNASSLSTTAVSVVVIVDGGGGDGGGDGGCDECSCGDGDGGGSAVDAGNVGSIDVCGEPVSGFDLYV